MARSVQLSSVLLFCNAGRDLDNSPLKRNIRFACITET
jgi:hypothetical protein